MNEKIIKGQYLIFLFNREKFTEKRYVYCEIFNF